MKALKPKAPANKLPALAFNGLKMIGDIILLEIFFCIKIIKENLMNKKLLKLLLTMSLCLSISGCEFGDDDEEFDWGSASVCGIFEDYFGSFEARKNYSAEEEGAIFYGQCNEFECAGNGLISINCDGNASGTVNETCNGNNYNFTGSASVESDIEIDATQVFFDADTETVMEV